jgi:6-pyruvoyltetrahydropterin/6-carboxytetrahydropterin synthase
MYYIEKRMEISAAHSLRLDYESKCKNLHGHNWHVRVYCKSRKLNENGMVEDFTLIKKRIQDRLDHMYLNDVLSFNPTAENMAKWMCNQIPTAYKVSVQESDGNVATYIKEGKRDEDQ